MNDRKYIVRHVNEFNQPYYYINDYDICRHKDSDEWEVSDLDKALIIIKDQLDVPEHELTIDEIRTDFNGICESSDEENFNRLRDYYNGRYALFSRIKVDLQSYIIDSPKQFHYDIPEKYNNIDVSSKENKATQIVAFIEIDIV